MQNLAQFKLNANTVFGRGALWAMGDFLAQNDYRRLGLIVDAGVETTSYWQRFKKELQAQAKLDSYLVYQGGEPAYRCLDSIRERFHDRLDCLVGVGGGSVMDVAKAVSVLTTNPKPAREYAGMGKIQKAGTPLILAPSTAGSGSEVTPFAVFIDREQKRKLGLNSEMYLPRLTAVDPDLTLSCPPSVTLSSGMDALTHALESFAARKHTVFSRILSREAFARVYKNLPLALARPDDPAPRRELSLGAYLAGAALLNSSGGPAGVLSYPIGTLFGAPHGLAGAIFLQPVAAFNVRGGYTDYCELYDPAAPSPSGGERAERAERFVEDLDRFCREVGVPRSLADFGVDQDAPPLIMEHLSALWAAVELNPVDMTAGDVEEILRALLKQRPQPTD